MKGIIASILTSSRKKAVFFKEGFIGFFNVNIIHSVVQSTISFFLPINSNYNSSKDIRQYNILKKYFSKLN